MYDESGSPIGFRRQVGTTSTPYYYVKNLQGDIVAIARGGDGAILARYAYDAWGNILSITDNAGHDISNKPNEIANINPLRYRGYYYDSETGLYYLKSRFYDPATGRFVNADSVVTTSSLLGTNLYTYCFNNPIRYTDSSGNLPTPDQWLGLGRNSKLGLKIKENVQLSHDQTPGPKVNPKIPPNPESGYQPPKKNPNPKKVRTPGGSYGWPSKDGGVWIPNNNQHGDPGWTVELPDGSHEHRYPNGHVRKHKFENKDIDFGQSVTGGAVAVGAGIAIIIIMADDATGVGIADDIALPVLFDIFYEGVQMIG